jgi:hypothetical protein
MMSFDGDRLAVLSMDFQHGILAAHAMDPDGTVNQAKAPPRSVDCTSAGSALPKH